jgi:hypothetical protein
MELAGLKPRASCSTVAGGRRRAAHRGAGVGYEQCDIAALFEVLARMAGVGSASEMAGRALPQHFVGPAAHGIRR